LSAADVLRAAQTAGVSVAVDGDDLVLDAAAQPPADVLAALKAHKPQIVALLRSGPPQSRPDLTRCAGCGGPIGSAARLELADGAMVHFRDYDCLIRYGDLRGVLGGELSRREGEPERPRSAVNLARCAGCGEMIRPDERVYDYHNPGDEGVVARAHSERLQCLIAWNERWHAAAGHEYEAAAYRRILEGEQAARRREHSPTNQASAMHRSAGVILTDEQRAAVKAIEDAIKRGETFALQGLAGTGKSTVAAHVARSRPGAYLCALTGKAASILRAKTGLEATTVHSAFYEFVREIEREGEPPRLEFRPAHLPGALKGQVLLLDESSLVDRQMAADILATGITVVAIGDPGQLPPINGDPFFTKASFTLNQIHRQALDSPIIRQAHAVRSSGGYEPDGDGVRVVTKLAADDLRAADIVLTGKRATRSRMNALCRTIRGITAPLPLAGEPLVCLRSCRKYGLFNGAIYYACRDLLDGDKTVGISTDAGDIEVHAEFLPPGHEYDKLDLPPGGWKTAFAFGYALTVHLAQGSEWDKALLIDEGHVFREDRVSWLYTGITRASESIVIAHKGEASCREPDGQTGISLRSDGRAGDELRESRDARSRAMVCKTGHCSDRSPQQQSHPARITGASDICRVSRPDVGRSRRHSVRRLACVRDP
jgi:exodeoxyribonuclease V